MKICMCGKCATCRAMQEEVIRAAMRSPMTQIRNVIRACEDDMVAAFGYGTHKHPFDIPTPRPKSVEMTMIIKDDVEDDIELQRDADGAYAYNPLNPLRRLSWK